MSTAKPLSWGDYDDSDDENIKSSEQRDLPERSPHPPGVRTATEKKPSNRNAAQASVNDRMDAILAKNRGNITGAPPPKKSPNDSMKIHGSNNQSSNESLKIDASIGSSKRKPGTAMVKPVGSPAPSKQAVNDRMQAILEATGRANCSQSHSTKGQKESQKTPQHRRKKNADMNNAGTPSLKIVTKLEGGTRTRTVSLDKRK